MRFRIHTIAASWGAMATDQPETTSTINDPNFNGLQIICSIHQQKLVDV
jgi:hypothetical protein